MPRVSSYKTRQALLTTGSAIDNPEDLPDHLQLYDEAGNPLSLGGFPREIRFYTTPSIADGEIANGIFTVWPGWRALKAATDIPARVRVYASSDQRTLDAERKIGVDPRGNHGLLFELVTTAEALSYTLSPKVDFATDDETFDYFMAVTNLSGVPDTVTVTFHLVRTE